MDERERPEPPGWASFFTPEQHATFMAHVERYFAGRDAEFAVCDDHVRVERDGKPSALGLANLAQTCHLEEEHDWPMMVAEHFDRLLLGSTRDEEIIAQIGDFEAVRDRLAVRLWHENLLAEVGGQGGPGDALIYRTDLEGTASVLVLDLPGSIKNVTPDEAKPWGKRPEDLFRLALENVPELCKPQVSRFELPNGQASYLITGEEFYVATYALLLHRFPECIGTYGALVGVPNRHAVISHPIEDLRIVEAVKSLVTAAVYMEQKGPGSITSDVYWYHDGRFTRLPYDINGNELDFRPPDELVEMLNGLEDPQG